MTRMNISLFGRDAASVDVPASVSRKLAPGQPDTWIDGGGSIGKTFFTPESRNPEALRRYEDVYRAGGPIAQMIDARSYMVFGTGSSFESPRDEVQEWLEDNFEDRDQLFPRIARDIYVYGESDTEIVETRAGGYSHVELINPKTLEPMFDDTGTIRAWKQTVRTDGKDRSQTLSSDQVSHFTLSKVGRQIGGVSLIGRAMDEVERYASNQDSRAKFLKRYGNPKRHIKAGRENGPSVNDNQLRKLRNRARRLEQDEDIVTGTDVNVETLDDFGGASVMDATEVDLKQLAISMGIPLELADIGGDGMGTGKPADLRLQAFQRQGAAEQRMLARQFVDQIVRPVLNRFSPFDGDEVQVTLEFEEIVSDKSEKANWMSTAKDVLTIDEIRNEFGYAPHEGDESELGPPEDSVDGGGGIFGMERANQSPLQGGDEFYSTEEAAADRAEEIGCSGTHTMEKDGETVYLPCSSHEEFTNKQPEQVRTQSEGEDAFDALLKMHESVAWDENDDRELFAFDDEDVPEFAKQWLRKAVKTGAVFSQFDTVEGSQIAVLKQGLLDSLETQHGWSINSLTENLMEEVDGLTKREAERIARTETQSIVANAREIGYEEEGLEDAQFRWVGASDNRTTDRCEWIKKQSQDGVSLERLKELVKESAERFPEEGPGGDREWTPHINCRHTFARAVNTRNNSRAMQDVEDIDTGDYPEAAVENAQMALDAREETGNPNDCGTRVGWERANQLVNGEDLSEDTIGRMASFARHEDNKEQGEEGKSDCGWMMWKAWGGDEGIEWAQRKQEEFDEARSMADVDALTRTEFEAGDIVMFGWEDGEPTKARVKEADSESITIGDVTVTGEPGEIVYMLEFVDTDGFVAKPESALRVAGNVEEEGLE